jgi:8-oxo-dGTP pyrophosphatase MutT (NUDIX family)
MNKKTAFVIMPFKKPYDGYFSQIYKLALSDAGFDATRGDDLFAPRPIMDDIRAKIVAADILLCEMSGRNPNVFYELGLAHAIGKPAILLSSAKKDIPFDLQHVRTIVYDTKAAGWESTLRSSIATAAREVSMSALSWPPPLPMENASESASGIPGVTRVFPNLPACEQEVLEEISASRTVRIFLQLGKSVLVGTPTIYEYLEKSLKSGSTVRILHAGTTNPYLSKRVAVERDSSYEEWISDIEYAKKKLSNLRNRSTGVVQSRTHDEAYYWLIFLFDKNAYVQPYIYERNNTKKAPVLKLTVDSDDASERSLYRVFDRYFDRKWDESIGSVRKIEDLFYLDEIETKSLAVAAVTLWNGMYLFVIPNRYIVDEPAQILFHSVGGKVHDGEKYEDALLREVKEEIDCEAKVSSAGSSLIMTSHSDIGDIFLSDVPAPSHVYKRTRVDIDSEALAQSIVWLLGYRVILNQSSVPQPRKEIAAILLLSPKMLRESVARRVKIKEIVASADGSKLIQAAGVSLAAEATLSATGLASILAATEYANESEPT